MKPYFFATILVLLTAISCNRPRTYVWRHVDASDGTFSVDLPGEPVKEDIPTQSVTGGSFISHRFNARASQDAAYGCVWWEDPGFKDRTAQQILDRARDSGLSGVNGKPDTEKQLTVQGHPARDVRAIARGNSAYDNRLVVVGNRVYTLLVIDVSGHRDEENIKRFFDSLVLH